VKEHLPWITAKVLSARLKELEEEGLVEKMVDAGSVPVRSEYTLTGSGLGLVEVIREIKRWALRWKIDNLACGAQDCHDCVL
jgi:DNA-binding HxlR family transcriptional regulator